MNFNIKNLINYEIQYLDGRITHKELMMIR